MPCGGISRCLMRRLSPPRRRCARRRATRRGVSAFCVLGGSTTVTEIATHPRVLHAAPPLDSDGIRARIEGRPALPHGPMHTSWLAPERPEETACGNVEIRRTDSHIPTTHN